MNMIDVKAYLIFGLAKEFARDLEIINDKISDNKLFKRDLDRD